MSSRELILNRIRTANRSGDLAGPDDGGRSWAYGQPTAMEDVLTRFVDRVQDYQATVIRCSEGRVAEHIGEALSEVHVTSVVLPSGAPPAWRDAVRARGIEVRDDTPLSHAELDDTGAVVTGSRVSIAETGTIVLDHGPDQGRRALTLVPDVHVCVVRSEQVVSDVPEAVQVLAATIATGHPLTWISGGSATSDIELDRVEGVHGPRTLIVLLVG
ncbi:MAG TPA: lactate utilization protein C [Candidatus Lustribacter sp.]|nr:lactate utilization protein C [Candidatus Lustribacter sp.]